MQGYHEVKMFRVSWADLRNGWTAPEGWKPMQVFEAGFKESNVVCRKWHRKEQ
jgi:hypothetical protein